MSPTQEYTFYMSQERAAELEALFREEAERGLMHKKKEDLYNEEKQATDDGNFKASKRRNPMKHLTPKKKKR